MSFTKKILVGLASGLFLGLFFGERVAFLHVAAEGFIQLLQMTVLPYVTVSLILGLGSLDYQEAWTLFKKLCALLLLLWAIAIGMVFAMPLAFPDWESASFFSTALLEEPEPFDFLGLYVPANPFHSLANNVVPAVVLFSVIFGVALIGVEKKHRLLEVMGVLSGALTRATHFVVSLTPYGVFAIAAHTAGTMTLEELERIQVYLVTYMAVALLATFWLLPALISTLTPIKYGEVIGATKDALITAFMTGNLFVVLPILTEASKDLLQRHQLVTEDTRSTPDVIVPASFNFPHTGKVLSLSFILFAAWFSESTLELAEYPTLAVTGLVTFFGSLTVAVPFLLDLFRIPADMFELFLATGIINSRFGTLIAAMHTVALAVLGTCAILGAIRLNGRSLLRYVVVTAALMAMTIGGLRYAFTHAMENRYEKDKILAGMHLLKSPAPAKVYRDPPERLADLDAGSTRLDAIHERGVLRVGYVAGALPYAFFNAAGDLVGFDIDMAHQLAREMGVRLELVPLERPRLLELLDGSYCDVAMSGFTVTPRRATQILHSEPYLDETVAFVVEDHRRAAFSSLDKVRSMGPVTLVIPGLPYLMEMVQAHLPEATLIPIMHLDEFSKLLKTEADAGILGAERGAAWSLLHPSYSVVIPKGLRVSAPLAYPVAGRDQAMATFLNAWIALKKRDGTIERLYDYWILGKDAAPSQPRWSIIRDVLHWVD